MLKVVQLVQTLAPGQILTVQYTACHDPVTRSPKSDCRGFQNWFYRSYMTYRLFLSSHLWLEFAHTPEAYKGYWEGQTELPCRVVAKRLGSLESPKSQYFVIAHLSSISRDYRQTHCFTGSWDNLFDHSGILTEANSFQLHIGAPGGSRRKACLLSQ